MGNMGVNKIKKPHGNTGRKPSVKAMENSSKSRGGHPSVEYNCERCGKLTKTRYSFYKKAKHHYCSVSCSSKNRGPSPKKGRKESREVRIKLSLAHGGNGDIDNNIGKRLRNSPEWKIWRTKVFERDNFVCNSCHNRSGELHPHHIVPVKECIKLSKIYLVFDINNGITMCKGCHMKLHGLVKGGINF